MRFSDTIHEQDIFFLQRKSMGESDMMPRHLNMSLLHDKRICILQKISSIWIKLVFTRLVFMGQIDMTLNIYVLKICLIEVRRTFFLINYGMKKLITPTKHGNGLAVLYFAVHTIRMPELLSYCTIHFSLCISERPV